MSTNLIKTPKISAVGGVQRVPFCIGSPAVVVKRYPFFSGSFDWHEPYVGDYDPTEQPSIYLTPSFGIIGVVGQRM